MAMTTLALCCVATAYAKLDPRLRGGDKKNGSAMESPIADTSSVSRAVTPLPDPFGPIPSPHDSRNVSFIYDPAKIYTILAQAGQLVHVEFGPDEKIVTIQLSDAVRWTVSRVESAAIAPRIFFKPTQIGIATSASIVTTAGRKYELLLQSVPEGSYRYQRVSWTYPEVVARQAAEKAAQEEAKEEEHRRVDSLTVSQPLALADLHWDYAIEGNAPFRPEAVFDDGRFIYLKLPSVAQDWPAVFVLEEKRPVLVDFVRRGSFLVVQRLAPALLLKLDEREVRIERRESKLPAWLKWK